MEIYLIRHTTPLIEKGICYGQSDLDVTNSFTEESRLIKNILPNNIERVYSSPLKRCTQLASVVFPGQLIQLLDDLREINCGIWEMQPWDDIPREELQPWMDDFVNVSIPGGESYTELHQRVTRCFDSIRQQKMPFAIITHGGVIRSILSHLNHISIKDSFNAFSLHYGCVIKLSQQGEHFTYRVLHNIIPKQKEQHRPSHL